MVFKITDIGKPGSIKRNVKRVGRGIGSGRGKTSGRGHKGARSRSGGGVYTPGFEGGQLPLIRRIPKRGFTNKFRQKWNVINIDRFEKSDLIKTGAVIDRDFLIKNRFIKGNELPYKILGKGKLAKALTVKANAFSTGAKDAIEKAGGKAEII